MDLLEQLQVNAAPGPDYEPDRTGLVPPPSPPVRLIAYYLPQFHPIPENDEWWGKGFTEWTNVTKAVPRYVGHYQPRLPGGLGFYDLRLPDTLREQAELALRHGIAGFCIHAYWFAGRRLLETPLQILLQHPDIDLPFCLNWANEPWSRVWDGSDRQMLIEQRHSPDDDIAFARAIEPALADPRYIRVDGRPLLMLYRPGLLPDASGTVDRWREHFTRNGFGEPYIAMPQAFGDLDPTVYGMDAAAGFPPHPHGWDLPPLDDGLTFLDPAFHGRVLSYDALAETAAMQPQPNFTLFPGVCPAWDNEARRAARGTGFVGSSPRKYGAWLEHACRRALRAPNPDERIVFINAWNEWAEGAYLEPDRHYGYAYLRETARTLSRMGQPNQILANEIQASDCAAANIVPFTRALTAGNPSSPLRGLIRAARRRGASAAEALADALRPS
jgi:lipopolysaccharide biosynthesis protein